MDSIKKYGEGLKQHYEKVILIVALIALGGAVFYLYGETQREKERISEFFQDVGRRAVKPVKPVDLTNYAAVVAKANNPPPLDLSLPHNVLNPVKWKQTPTGELIKEVTGTEGDLDLLEVTRHDPLNFSIHFDRTAGPGYWINITNEVAAGYNRRIAQFATLNVTNLKVFILREVQGEPENPTALVLELKETGERVTISKEKPFVRAEAYEVDLRFPPENKNFPRQRVGATLRFGGEEYRIVGINQSEIIFMGDNDKRYSKTVGARQEAAANPPPR
jgi:hypothetical protein